VPPRPVGQGGARGQDAASGNGAAAPADPFARLPVPDDDIPPF